MDFSMAVPFLAVLLGIMLQVFGPYFVKALRWMEESGEWPVFDVKYLVAPMAAVLLDVLAFAIILLTSPGMFAEIAALEFVLAVLVGYGGTDALKEAEKVLALVVARARASR